MKYLTYTHSANGVVFYVGCGTRKRPWSKHGRTDSWKKHVKDAGGYVVNVVGEFESRYDALEYESELISFLRPACNKEIRGIRLRHEPRTLIHINIPLSDDDHATIKRRAKAAGVPMYRYVIAMARDGKVNKKPK